MCVSPGVEDGTGPKSKEKRNNKKMKRGGRGRDEPSGTRERERKRGEGRWKGVVGTRGEAGGGRGTGGERREDVAAGYQQRTTKVIKLGWMAGSDRLVGHSIGNSTNLWTS